MVAESCDLSPIIALAMPGPGPLKSLPFIDCLRNNGCPVVMITPELEGRDGRQLEKILSELRAAEHETPAKVVLQEDLDKPVQKKPAYCEMSKGRRKKGRTRAY